MVIFRLFIYWLIYMKLSDIYVKSYSKTKLFLNIFWFRQKKKSYRHFFDGKTGFLFNKFAKNGYTLWILMKLGLNNGVAMLDFS